MKTIGVRMMLAGLLVFIISAAMFAQSPRNYQDGTVWSVTFVKVKPNMDNDYLNGLKTTWNAVSQEAVKEGLILSYKILQGPASNPQDFDILLMQEFKNFASLDGNEDKWEAIEKKIVGGEEAMKTLNQSRVNMREIFGQKLMREVVYK